jgi:inner membrane protein
MDTLTHALSGALLARALTPGGRKPWLPRASERWAGPPVSVGQAMVVGTAAAVFPDLDFVLGWISDLAYLRGHRGVTHSLLLLPVWAVLLGALFSRFFRRPDAWKRYAWLAAGGLGIHILGDWITPFGTMLLAPLSDARFGLGSTFIIDLVVSGIILAGLVGSLLWRRSRAPAIVALALLPVWIGVSVTGRAEALAFARAWAQRQGIAAQEVAAAPRPASPFNWTVVVFDGAQYHYAHVNTRRAEPLAAGPGASFIRRFSAPYQPLALTQWQVASKFGNGRDEALVRSVWAAPEFAFFRWFAQFPTVERVERDDAAECVFYRDLRFATPGRNEIPFRYGLCREPGEPWQAFRLDGDARVAVQ